MLDKADGQIITENVRLVHAVGMHARPAVKLTKLAKKFQAQISVRVAGAAEWINAKSVAKIMAMRAAYGSTIEIKASGSDAETAVAALVNLIATDFPDEAS
ncbi:HPr family phosphocarrier protein [Bradyrhizobium sp. DASA03005]|uniref:HPr family phosphocarrier protein n=1 Tax=Bradyrhizobium TaxID=374 RepID=UPI00155EB808|nr:MULTISPECIES: HPr family phosphocarrier protein [Bradyrhizobium]MBR1168092.1 HPr family phosphocarrier protein [Bradyrhizobium liaoningense]MDD1518843.1 HPr family phosphocarrier protein [Bradyrhizobium sp. WBAH30]MDD1541159.1 HPr family phosphocarrier protein [Bradyrhizobium sp. WBAH41]MDD1557217.1 HPr family phosphocarrier protein [Bradyrhizobium sp. WBAH23]MDD1563794.1 HPr family phosphocarrier protein [Bradyrhizobium sp. WBAH33]